MTVCTGRFAPTPSGPLHAGSLTAAVISWLDARSRQGRWHLRIDDSDRPRTVPGAADEILRTLDACGLGWDGAVVFQSEREPAYREALARLEAAGRVFACACSRKEVAAAGLVGLDGPIYPGTCREGLPRGREGRSVRLRAEQRHWTITDRSLGPLGFDLHRLGGDFVIRRADGVFAYQLATVVDDIALGVTDVVRGIDLLGSVPRQLQLYRGLGRPQPRYLHHPVVIADSGRKLAKSSGAAPAPRQRPAALLAPILAAIGTPGVDPGFAAAGPGAVDDLLEHARRHWSPGRLPPGPIPEACLRPTGA
ncbi:tRNA glutamyl-Q(34) synthetase GluQRS [Thioalkalivibrio sp.]|uniref:tRNA glutamyl-Q(34) synthetase GluQRS n=1 Tax=Thioalkalivibrio sp. TaxID=2093813 RepID=UPI00356868F5